MTKQLLQALTPSKKLGADGDNYELLRDLEAGGQADDEFVSLEYPSGFRHLISILVSTDDKKQLAMSNPDGYFYLLFLKTCLKIISVCSVFCFCPLVFLYLSHNDPGEEDENKKKMGLFQLVSLPPCLNSASTFHIALAIAFLTAFIAMYYLIDFCNEMSLFEFSPDLQILD
mmetsp:Transcript_42371/g.65034  ORF Transcript_42371/g.65034 Transcript_42371/m.65034 type:complete len:172 (+) Transcript_42371:796-1311(+)